MADEGKRVFVLFCLVLVAAVLFCGCGKKATETPIQKEIKALQGTWVGAPVGGSQGNWTFIISQNHFDTAASDHEEWYKGIFEVDVTTEPKRITFTIEECHHEDGVGKTALGIYKLEADTLTLVPNGPGETNRPSTFDENEDGRVFVLVRK